MQAVTVAAAATHKLELVNVAGGWSGVVGLVVGNPLLDGQDFLVWFHARCSEKHSVISACYFGQPDGHYLYLRHMLARTSMKF